MDAVVTTAIDSHKSARVNLAVHLDSSCESIPAIAPLDMDVWLESEPQAVLNFVTLVKTSLMPMVALNSRTTPSSTLGTVPQNSLPAEERGIEKFRHAWTAKYSSATMAHCQVTHLTRR